METIRQWIAALIGIMNAASSLALLALMILTAADILSRKITGVSIIGVVELSEFLMLILVYSALAGCESMNRNVKVDILTARMSGRVRAATGVLSSLAGCLLFALIAAAALSYAISIRASGEESMDLQIAKYPFALLTAAGCAAMSLACAGKLLSSRKDPH